MRTGEDQHVEFLLLQHSLSDFALQKTPRAGPVSVMQGCVVKRLDKTLFWFPISKRMSKNYIYRVQKDTGEKVFAGARALNARPVTEDARTRHAEQTGIYRGNMRGVS